ncbi:MAG: ompR [Rickettsiaceae bacterium]|jgi:two-component system phosphate regulon response regulator OmpR|nr:ompR [Rickettsiaceae bacterium]
MKPITHILILDDDTRIRDLLARFLQDKGFFVSTAKDAYDARNQTQEFIFDLIIADVMMPGENGVEFTKKLRKSSNTPVLMLTAMGDVEDRISGLESGADDYLAKPFEPRELLLRIQRILQRTKNEVAAKIIKFGNISYNPAKNSLEQDGENIYITSNEAQLLTILCSNLQTTVSREELARFCGGINERSIDVQITRLRNKIEQDPKKPVYLKTIRGQGYVLYSD